MSPKVKATFSKRQEKEDSGNNLINNSFWVAFICFFQKSLAIPNKSRTFANNIIIYTLCTSITNATSAM